MPRHRWARLPRVTARPRARRSALPALPPLLLAIPALPGCRALLTEGTSAVAGIGGTSVADAVGADAAATAGIGLGVQAVGRAGPPCA